MFKNAPWFLKHHRAFQLSRLQHIQLCFSLYEFCLPSWCSNLLSSPLSIYLSLSCDILYHLLWHASQMPNFCLLQAIPITQYVPSAKGKETNGPSLDICSSSQPASTWSAFTKNFHTEMRKYPKHLLSLLWYSAHRITKWNTPKAF